jgi:predicted phage terminase large subunit-like protein
VVRSQWYRELFPLTRISRDSENETVLKNFGGRMATSIGGVLTGRGADIILIDDPLKASDAASAPRREAVKDWYRATLISRLNDKTNGAIVIVTQRLHLDDLVGYVLSTGEKWEVLELPAIAGPDQRIRIGDNRWHWFREGEVLQAEREPHWVLQNLQRELGSEAFSAQYLQQPVPPGGNMFRRNWVLRYERLPRRDKGDIVLQSWDTASKNGPANDWSVCSTWLRKGGHHYLVDLFRERLDYPALRSRAMALAKQYRPTMVVIEDAGVGPALIAELRQSGINVVANRPELAKEARAAVQAATFEGGRVHFPVRAPWLSTLEAELFAFPGSRHDDQVDSIVQALAYRKPAHASTSVSIIDAAGRIRPLKR